MKIQLKHESSASLIHAVLRMSGKEYRALRTYMHTKEGEHVWFPYGSTITKRGRGWYRLAPLSEKRAQDKMEFALRTLRTFMREEEQKVEDEIKRLAPIMRDPDLHLASFSQMHEDAAYGYLGEPRPAPPASAAKLHQLAARFNQNSRRA